MLNALVSTIDKTLRARQGIFEYTTCPRCIFRAHLTASTGRVVLVDGTDVSAGSRLINLHLWNEHVPPFPAAGPTLSWGRRIRSDLAISLTELATFVGSSSALEDVAAVRANMAFGSPRQTQVLSNLAARYGFVRAAAPEPSQSAFNGLHQLGEDILISMIVISQNPAAFRARFRRDRVPVYLRRTELVRRFGSGAREISPAP
jgi:hypothetical protein